MRTRATGPCHTSGGQVVSYTAALETVDCEWPRKRQPGLRAPTRSGADAPIAVNSSEADEQFHLSRLVGSFSTWPADRSNGRTPNLGVALGKMLVEMV